MSSGLILPRIYAITDRAVSGIASHVEIARRLYSVGVHLVQIREKEMEDRALLAQLDEVSGLARATDSLLVVNDRVDVALVAGTGVHLGEEDLPAVEARKILPPGAVVGVSTHDVEAARRALSDPACDYVAFGPVFSSATKTVRNARGLEDLARAAEGRRKPVVAIGGITAETLDSVFDAGADSAAMIAGLLAGGAVRIEENARRALDVARRREIPGRIYLVGFMGSGKTAIGRRMAERLDRPFVDLDAEIERTSGVTIRALFESDGEAAFREREAAFLEGTEAVPGAVVATGGGCYVREGNRRAISKLGTAVFLDVPLRTLLSRLAGKTDRPLFRDAEQAARLYAEREPFYRMQTVCVRLEGDSVEHAADRVLDALADPGRRRPVL